MKKIIGWSVALVLVAGIGVVYMTVPKVKAVVDRTLTSLGIGAPKADETYWCPMHPDIVRKGPGTCPV